MRWRARKNTRQPKSLLGIPACGVRGPGSWLPTHFAVKLQNGWGTRYLLGSVVSQIPTSISRSAWHGVGRSDDAFGGFGVESPLIGVWFAVEESEDEEDESANDGYEGDEVPPAAFADVVKAADRDC